MAVHGVSSGKRPRNSGWKKCLLLSSHLIRCSVMLKGKRGHSSKLVIKPFYVCLSPTGYRCRSRSRSEGLIIIYILYNSIIISIWFHCFAVMFWAPGWWEKKTLFLEKHDSLLILILFGMYNILIDHLCLSRCLNC